MEMVCTTKGKKERKNVPTCRKQSANLLLCSNAGEKGKALQNHKANQCVSKRLRAAAKRAAVIKLGDLQHEELHLQHRNP